MWKSYMIYCCPQCGYERKTDQKIYRFDDDRYHMQAYSENRAMQASQSRAAGESCPECGEANMTFARWSEW